MDLLDSKGFCLINEVFSAKEIEKFKEKFAQCEAEVQKIVRENEPDPYHFIQLFDKENVIKMQSYCENSIIETAKDRYDVRIQLAKDLFQDVPKNEQIAELMKKCLKER